MSSIHIEPDHFPDVVIQYLLDSMMTDNMGDNEAWDNVVKKMEGAGMKAQLLKYYLNTNAVDKSKYKDIKKVFHSNGMIKSTINIQNKKAKKDKAKKDSTTKSLIKKVLRLIKAHKEKYTHGMPLNEERIDKIIENVLKETDNG